MKKFFEIKLKDRNIKIRIISHIVDKYPDNKFISSLQAFSLIAEGKLDDCYQLALLHIKSSQLNLNDLGLHATLGASLAEQTIATIKEELQSRPEVEFTNDLKGETIIGKALIELLCDVIMVLKLESGKYFMLSVHGSNGGEVLCNINSQRDSETFDVETLDYD